MGVLVRGRLVRDGVRPPRGLELDVAGVGGPALGAGLVALGGEEEGAGEAEEDDEQPEGEEGGGDEGLGADGVGEVGRDGGDGVGDGVRGRGAGVGEEGVGAVGGGGVARNGGRGAEGEGVVGEEGEVDVRVVGDPVEPFLDAGDLEPDEAVEDLGDGAVQDGAAEGGVEGVGYAVDEDVERVVEGARRGVDPAEDVLVDVVVRGDDGVVDAVGPVVGGVFERGDHFVGKAVDFVDERRHFLLDDSEEDVLAETGEEAGDGEGEDEERGGRCGVCDDPSGEDLSSGGSHFVCSLNAGGGCVWSRGDIDDVKRINGTIAHDLSSLLHGSPLHDIAVSHRDAYQDSCDYDDGKEDLPSKVCNIG